jgi:hypothetical protein
MKILSAKYFILFLYLIFFISCCGVEKDKPKASGGVIDLRNWDFVRDRKPGPTEEDSGLNSGYPV